MKNVTRAGRDGMYRVSLLNAPPLRGWAISYVSGMEGEAEVEPGFYREAPDRRAGDAAGSLDRSGGPRTWS
jgi:hypothetical protein